MKQTGHNPQSCCVVAIALIAILHTNSTNTTSTTSARIGIAVSAFESSSRGLLNKANHIITKEKDANAAFQVLAQVYEQDPSAPGFQTVMESCLRLQLSTQPNNQDVRFGLASLLVDQERYEQATEELKQIIIAGDLATAADSEGSSNKKIEPCSSILMDRAFSLLYRSKAAICDWTTRAEDDERLVNLVQQQINNNNSNRNNNRIPVVHPFEALKWPCISMALATQIAKAYGQRAVESQGLDYQEPTFGASTSTPTVTLYYPNKKNTIDRKIQTPRNKRRIRIGFVSPDLTPSHPMAFLLQHFFSYFDRNIFEIHIFSLARKEDCPSMIINGVDSFTELLSSSSSSSSSTPKALAQDIQSQTDILIDLCGYTGPSLVAEILAHRPAPIQISLLGFPGSSGAPYMDYIIGDETVVPSSLRKYYSERIIYMPHSYFCNSHAASIDRDRLLSSSASFSKQSNTNRDEDHNFGLPDDAFIFCCHSRPDKLDPIVVRTWITAITKLRHKHGINAILWLLRSCPTMESNIRSFVSEQINDYADNHNSTDNFLYFCDIAPRNVHLRRLAHAHVFLDTCAYNAHSVGCDALYMTTPMITMISQGGCGQYDKWPSRVGASLLKAAVTTTKTSSRTSSLPLLVASSYDSYMQLMTKCALDKQWFTSIQQELSTSASTSALFDTKEWVKQLEQALLYLGENTTTTTTTKMTSTTINMTAATTSDIYIVTDQK